MANVVQALFIYNLSKSGTVFTKDWYNFLQVSGNAAWYSTGARLLAYVGILYCIDENPSSISKEVKPAWRFLTFGVLQHRWSKLKIAYYCLKMHHHSIRQFFFGTPTPLSRFCFCRLPFLFTHLKKKKIQHRVTAISKTIPRCCCLEVEVFFCDRKLRCPCRYLL